LAENKDIKLDVRLVIMNTAASQKISVVSRSTEAVQ